LADQKGYLCDKLHNATSFLDFSLCFSRNVTGLDDDRGLREAALAENFGVAEAEKVEDGCRIVILAAEVLFALFVGDERPQLFIVSIR
jgi:hypothetical protein